MAYATLDDLLQVEPTIQEYGVLDWDVELARSETEINRVLTVRWWPGFAKSIGVSTAMNISKLDPTQWTQAAVYHALAYHICPKLTKFEMQGQEDKFQVMMEYYQGRFEHEMDLCIREGVRYDVDGDNSFEYNTETKSKASLRLVR